MKSRQSVSALASFSARPSWLTAEEWAAAQAEARAWSAHIRHIEAQRTAAEARKTWRVIPGGGRKEAAKPQLTLVELPTT